MSGPTSIHAEETEVEVTTVEELNDEVTEASTEGEETDITIADDIGSGSVVISSGQDIVFDTNQDSVTFNSSITINEGGKLTLNGNINYQKQIINYGALIINGGVFNASIRNSGSNATFEMNGGEITGVRAGTSSGALVLTNGATGTMNGGSIHDNTITNQYAGTVYVEKNASFTMNGGTISNNTSGTQINTSGGVMVRATTGSANAGAGNSVTATFTMNGGTISNNSSPRGAGVFVWGGSSDSYYYWDVESKATFTMNGGTIENNHATGVLASYGYLEGGGGGVYVFQGADFVMNGGSIINNTAIGTGGGVATYDEFVRFFGKVNYSSSWKYYNGKSSRKWYQFFPASFTMNGGIISGNSAYNTPTGSYLGVGGGIYVGSSQVYLNAGLIENNYAQSQGGGVYVASVPYVLHMQNVLVTANEATVLGGGIWTCPTGSVVVYLNSNAAVFDNTSNGAGDDVVVLQPSRKQAITTLSDRIIGGGLANWTKDGGANSYYQLGYANSDARYDANGENITYTGIENSLEVYSLKSLPEEYAKELAAKLATLIIRNNRASRGAGIGSNGSMVIGEYVEQPADYSVTKVWKDGKEKPESITVWLVTEDGDKVQSAVLSEENGWSYVFEGLPTNMSYQIVEEEISGWKANYEVNDFDTIIVNEPVTTYTVKKVWNTQDASLIPENITVQLLNSLGEVVGEVVLSVENDWTHTFTDLSMDTTYTVKELALDGWTVSYINTVDEDGNYFTEITNTPEEPEKPEYPDGGRGDEEEPEEPEKPKQEKEKEEPKKEEPHVENGVQTSMATNTFAFFGMAVLAIGCFLKLRKEI